MTFLIASCDAPESWQMGPQDPATPVMEGMIYFHNYLFFYIVLIAVFVCWFLAKIIISFNAEMNAISQKFTHSSLLEIVWTIFPAVLLIIIAVPSFSLLYSLDEVINPELTLKVIGHQWYWSYEYSDVVQYGDFETIAFDSYMVPTSDLSDGTLRLLEVDNRVVLPVGTHVRLLVSAADVLHSWAMPSFGVKIDAVPGRLSQVSVFLKRFGVFYGQCSEICGVNHGFMPIVVAGVNHPGFCEWLGVQLNTDFTNLDIVDFGKATETPSAEIAEASVSIEEEIVSSNTSTNEVIESVVSVAAEAVEAPEATEATESPQSPENPESSENPEDPETSKLTTGTIIATSAAKTLDPTLVGLIKAGTGATGFHLPTDAQALAEFKATLKLDKAAATELFTKTDIFGLYDEQAYHQHCSTSVLELYKAATKALKYKPEFFFANEGKRINMLMKYIGTNFTTPGMEAADKELIALIKEIVNDRTFTGQFRDLLFKNPKIGVIRDIFELTPNAKTTDLFIRAIEAEGGKYDLFKKIATGTDGRAITRDQVIKAIHKCLDIRTIGNGVANVGPATSIENNKVVLLTLEQYCDKLIKNQRRMLNSRR